MAQSVNPFIASLIPPKLPEQLAHVLAIQEAQKAALEQLCGQMEALCTQLQAPIERDAQLISFHRPGELSYVTSEKLRILMITWGGVDQGEAILYAGEQTPIFHLFNSAFVQSTIDLSGQKRLIMARGTRLWWAVDGTGNWAASIVAVPA